MLTFHILPASPCAADFMKFGIWGQLTDVIMCVKFLVDRFRGYGVLIPPKLPFPIDLLRRPYNSVRTAVRHCDKAAKGNWVIVQYEEDCVYGI